MALKNVGLAKKIICHGLEMRSSFDIGKHTLAQWFPGHMIKGMRRMQQKLSSIDCIVEVHDARIPISGRNQNFIKTLFGVKPYIFVLNKVDLISRSNCKYIMDYYNSKGVSNVYFTNCKAQKNESVTKFVPRVADLINNSNRFNRTEAADFNLLIIGVPNVGKSSLINVLRNKFMGRRKGTLVGKNPGVTTSLLERIKISQDPLIYLFDTPGILPPQIEDVETGLKLALVNNIKEHLVGEDIIADYLLYRMNKSGNHSYVDYMELAEPSDEIQKLLVDTATKKDYMRRMRRLSHEGGYYSFPDISRTAHFFLEGYRQGKFGDLQLDDELISAQLKS